MPAETKRQNITMKQEIRLGTTKKKQEFLCEIPLCLRDDNQYSSPRKEQKFFDSTTSEKDLKLFNLKLDFTEQGFTCVRSKNNGNLLPVATDKGIIS